MKKLIVVLVVIGVILIIFFALGPFFILQEGEQAVIVRFGEIVKTHIDAGLKIKVPVIDTVVRYSKRILSWDGYSGRIPTRKPETQYIFVNTTARWRIVKPDVFYKRLNTINRAYSILDDRLDSVVRTIISENFLVDAVRDTNDILETLRSEAEETQLSDGSQNPTDLIGDITEGGVLTEGEIPTILPLDSELGIGSGEAFQRKYIVEVGRQALAREMQSRAIEAMINPESESKNENQYGIELIDIVIRQIKYSDELRESVFQRMIKERNRIAERTRAVGGKEKNKIIGDLEKARSRILSEAYETAQTTIGEGDALAAETYATAYEQNPDFFLFWRSLESYKKVLPKFKKTLSTESEYFNYLYNSDGR